MANYHERCIFVGNQHIKHIVFFAQSSALLSSSLKLLTSYAKGIQVKPCMYRPLGLQEYEAVRILRHSAHEGGKVVSPTHRPFLSPRKIPGTHLC